MNNLKKGRKLHRVAGQRKALIKALSVALIENEKIKTTEAKAKELRPKIEKMITRATRKTVFNMREIRKVLPEKAAKKLFDDIAPRYEDRRGGYTRIIKLGRRSSDGASIAQIELV